MAGDQGLRGNWAEMAGAGLPGLPGGPSGSRALHCRRGRRGAALREVPGGSVSRTLLPGLALGKRQGLSQCGHLWLLEKAGMWTLPPASGRSAAVPGFAPAFPLGILPLPCPL